MSKADFNIKPLHERIVIKPYPPDEVSDGGIIVPDSVKQRPSKAWVVAVGGGLKERPMEIKVGDTVFHIKGAGTLIEHDKTEYFIITDRDVLAIL
jgi:chaperonin GroES